MCIVPMVFFLQKWHKRSPNILQKQTPIQGSEMGGCDQLQKILYNVDQVVYLNSRLKGSKYQEPRGGSGFGKC
jgi:hypothetical protein